MEIGLGVPREKVILVQKSHNRFALYQPATKRNLTRTMTTFTSTFLDSLGAKNLRRGGSPHDESSCDGFILKRKSPSCGIKSAKLYDSTRMDAKVIRRDTGLFAAGVLKRFPNLAITDEEALNNPRLREHWLSKLFLLAGFRTVQKSHNVKKLMAFHQHNRALLIAHNATHTRQMDKLLSTVGRVPTRRRRGETRHLDPAVLSRCRVSRSNGQCSEPDLPDIYRLFREYESHLHHILSRPIRVNSAVQVLREAFEHFKPHFSRGERASFIRTLEAYRLRRIPLYAAIKTVQVWGVRYEKTYLRQHSFFRPFPGELMGELLQQ